MTVWKYPLPVSTVATLHMPAGASILSTHVQHDEPCVWALVNPYAPLVRRELRIICTGHPIDAMPATAKFVGTVLLDGNDVVLHIFDLGEQS